MSQTVATLIAVLSEGPASYRKLQLACADVPDEALRGELARMQVAGQIGYAPQAALRGRSGYALLDRPTRHQTAFIALQGEILEALDLHGPAVAAVLRERLGVASQLKFDAALAGLHQAHLIERNNGAVRLDGDERAWPAPGTLSGQYQRKRREQRQSAAWTDDEGLGARLVNEALGD